MIERECHFCGEFDLCAPIPIAALGGWALVLCRECAMHHIYIFAKAAKAKPEMREEGNS